MESQRLAKQPVSVLAGPYGHPAHPALVAVPIGAWLASLVFDAGSMIVDDPGFLTQGSRWLIAIGVLGALAAAGVGTLDLLGIPTRTRAFRTALLHAALNLTVTAAYGVNFAVRASQDPVAPVGAAPFGLSLASAAVLGGSAYLGGRLAYRYGVRVADETTQAEGFRSTAES